MTDNQKPPTVSPNVVQASGQIASDVVGGLKGSPALLAIIVLNVVCVGIAAWVLSATAANRHEAMLMMMRACLPHVPSGQYFEEGAKGDRAQP